MPLKRRRSPQEKKRLSLSRDRRNDYGENDKGSRKAIPLRKKLATRAVRRGDTQDLLQDPERADAALPLRLKVRWRKWPDGSLGDHIKQQMEHRATRAMRKKRSRQ